MKALIICEKFAPENTVGAIRMSKLAKFLKQDRGWEVSVLTRRRKQYDELGDAKYVDEFFYADESPLVRDLIGRYKRYSSSGQYNEKKRVSCNAQKAAPHHRTTIKEYVKSVFTVAYSELTPRSYARNGLKQLAGKINSFDAVISSFGPASSHYIARKLKEKNPNIIWIADFRDPLAIGESTKGFLNTWGRTFTKRVCARANAYTVASRGFIHCLGLDDSANVNVITNGYDADDFSGSNATQAYVKHDKMRLVYTGTLFAGSRDISAIFRAVRELIEAGKIDPEKLCFSYAGQHRAEFMHQYESSGLKVQTDAYDVIPKAQAIAMQQSADVLMIAAWNTQEYQGSLPLKLYEYLYTGKPVLCCVCGTAANSELKQIITSCSAGACYEEANAVQDFEPFKAQILEYYNRFCAKGYIEADHTDAHKAAIARFDYRNIAGQFAGIVINENERKPHA